MLQKLSIKNYTLIKELEIPFYKGLSIITGETGAGKSILLGALKLVLGERADYSIFHEESEKCIIEAEFLLPSDFQLFFLENDLDFDTQTLIRREISPDGKSRAFINDSPTKLQTLQALSYRLIDIHSQFETTQLFSEDYQFQFLDNFSGLQATKATYHKLYHQWKENQSQLKLKEDSLAQSLQNQDYNQFLLEELQALPLETLQLEDLESELSELENVQELQENLGQINQIVSDENGGLSLQLQNIQHLLNKAAKLSPKLQFIAERLDSTRIEMQDIENDIARFATDLEYQPDRIALLSDQINGLHRLLQKHHCQNIGELIDQRNALEQAQSDFSNLESDILDLRSEIEKQEAELNQQAHFLDSERKKSIPTLEGYVGSLLTEVGLEKSQFSIQLLPIQHFHTHGKSEIQILFSANTGMPLQPIKSGISGGERSRVMLVLKKVMAEHQQLATLILDEIDTGVSGKVAHAVGNLMQSMAQNMQLIVITHLAQIASKGTHHYKVYKEEREGKTHTYIQLLNSHERVQEVAQLISGEQLTEASITQAKELLNTP